jgi:hypothetical protein
MHRLHLIASTTLLIGIVLAAGSPAASEIYKWTDADGTVHYGDRPTGADFEERLNISSEPTDPQRVQEIVQARAEARSERQEAEAAMAANQPSPEELRAEAEERAEKCTQYKDRLQKFVTSRRLYKHDENGERVYLDEEETLAARARVQEKVEEYCSP